MRVRNPSSGAVMVEFALCFPILVFGLLCVVQVLMIQQTRAKLNQAAYLAAREYALTSDAARAEEAAFAQWEDAADSLATVAIAFHERNDGTLGTDVLAEVTAAYRLLPIPIVWERLSSSFGTIALRSAAAAPIE